MGAQDFKIGTITIWFLIIGIYCLLHLEH